MIIPMRKMRLIIFQQDEKTVLEALQKTGEFMPIESKETTTTSSLSENAVSRSDDLQRTHQMLKLSNQYHKKYHHKFLEQQPEISYETFLKENLKGKEVCKKFQVYDNQLKALDADIGQCLKEIETLQPWEKMDIPLNQLKKDQYISVIVGMVPEISETALTKVAEEAGAEIKTYGKNKKNICFIILQTNKEMPELMAQLKKLEFSSVNLPDYPCTAAQKLKEFKEKIAIDQQKKNEIDQCMQELSKDEKDIKLLAEQYETKQQIQNINFLETKETILIEGWVCKDRINLIKNIIHNTIDYYDLKFLKPVKSDFPPTVTRNPYFWAQFETITDMYSKPNPSEIDPALIAGPWYWVIFGMMMGDVGYGLCMLIIFYLFKKIKKPRGNSAKLINTLFYSSFTTIIFGFLFGSYFGETWHPILFAPLANPLKMLYFTLVVGILHIFSGMAIKIAENIRDGHFWDAIFDQVSWMMLISGLGLLFIPSARFAGKILAITGAAIILCTAGRENKKLAKKIVGGLLGLYNISSYLSDILSYSRILALSLATGVIGMVMNLLARMVAVNIGGMIVALVIYIIGHSFNLAMSLLSAYVHDSRLQYIEFFNKFYEGGGKPFKPLSIQSNHVNVKIDKNNK
ncbi:V-type ATP synthase subunit I [Pseudoramibacter sp.]|jgi:V/A-type H+-transporting ATPase subunit I|uniref:V-type ATP synthase subunit I n=1 Tax=Pseudoramibacter sp. TaxID=2034862 RepID=UPI0025E05A2F|nr:V-type ATP synthase subunit I [Pseudoramibacter sp.]MCH4072867.1 V-type ATP synthase subunit I [Pseudoramibacter sp.]MCH4106638.1 V-type ATP synthase subunit I [Pseudoramibacter sp.]